ncbi:flagellar protein FlgN [Anaerosinus massiliensis]|uniref:flagellar protein FlgN n=1 Tax=Massilibacillus massiliensis TaxID=1806837 RepID=UPI000DA613D8|nr:flagellar protein FlgN [Massilibacillus massiliensis]
MKQLTVILKMQSTLYGQLLQLSKQQTEKLVANDAIEVQKAAKEIEKIMQQLSKLEIQRQESITACRAAYKMSENLTLRQLIEKIPNHTEDKENAVHLVIDLEEKTAELKEYINQNKILLEKAMQFIDFNVNLITSTSAGTTYAAKGQEGTAVSKRKMFDQSI